MSLINDALKRAKQAQQEAAPPPAPNLQLRPIEPAQYTRQGLGLIVPAALVVMALLLLLLVWQQNQRNGPAQPTEVQARTARPAVPTAAPPAAPAVVASAPAAQPISDALPATSAIPAADPTDALGSLAVSVSSNQPTALAADSGVTNTPAVTEPQPPKPAPPKLQAIVFSPIRPSVMINGKTLFIGDKLNGLRVTAIDQESVTLVGAGQTNILTLSE
jgi:hypothetical protein